MPTTFLDRLKAFLEQEFPVKAGLWNYSNDNALPADWLYATPLNVWGVRYADIKQAVVSDTVTGGFKLAPCPSTTSGNQRCYPLQASALKPGDPPKSLLVGHSAEMVDAVNAVIRNARVFVDFLTLTPPDGRFLDGFRNAITYISNKPADQRPIIRILYSNPPPKYNLYAKDFLADVTSRADPTQAMTIYAGAISSAIDSWNHAKIVAADGVESIVGGHNLWGGVYLGENPVFDVSMRLTGGATIHSHDFADFLWRFTLDQLAGQSSWWKFANSASYTFDSALGRCVVADGGRPNVKIYTQAKQSFPSSSAGSIPVLSVGRKAAMDAEAFLPSDLGYFGGNGEPADRAIIQLVDWSQSHVRMSLQSLISPVLTWWRAGWNSDLFVAIGKALRRGVRFDIVMSNPGAMAGPPPGALYEGGTLADVNQYLLGKMLDPLGFEELEAKRLITNQFKVGSIRFSADDTLPGGVGISAHAKTFIFDDKIFYIGSQNLYLCNLNEFGYIVEDDATAQSYVQSYWEPLWTQSKRTATADFSEELHKEELAEAVQFIFELQRNQRLYKSWSDTLAERQNLDSPEDRELTAKYLAEIITNAGFQTTPAVVLEALKNPIFTTNRATAKPNQAARAFVQKVMNDRALLQAFAAIIEAQAGKTDAESDAAITTFLKSKGYECNALQVSGALNELRCDVLLYWQGEFDGWIKPDGGTSYTDFTPHEHPHDELRKRSARTLADTASDEPRTVAGPSLTIVDNVTFKIGDEVIKEFTFNAGYLSWTRTGTNLTSGSITLSSISRPGLKDPFVGFEFFGSVTYPGDASGPYRGTYSYYGRYGQSIDGDDDPKTPFPWPVWILIGAGALVALGGLGLAISKGRDRYRRWLEDREIANSKKYDPVPTVDPDERAVERAGIELGEITSSSGRVNRRLRVTQTRNLYEFQQSLAENTQKVKEAGRDVPWDALSEQFKSELDRRIQDAIDRRSESALDANLDLLTESISRELRNAPREIIGDFVLSSIEVTGMDPATRDAIAGSELVEPKVRSVLSTATATSTSYLQDSVKSKLGTMKDHYLQQNISALQEKLVTASDSLETTKSELAERRQALSEVEETLRTKPTEEAKQKKADLDKEIQDLVDKQVEQEKERQEASDAERDRQTEAEDNKREQAEAEKRRSERSGEVFEGK